MLRSPFLYNRLEFCMRRYVTIGLALAAGPERWTAMEGGFPIIASGECIGGIGVSGGDWETDARIARAAVEAIGASWSA